MTAGVFYSTPERTHVRVKSWTKNINIFDKRFTVVPVCYRYTHVHYIYMYYHF